MKIIIKSVSKCLAVASLIFAVNASYASINCNSPRSECIQQCSMLPDPAEIGQCILQCPGPVS